MNTFYLGDCVKYHHMICIVTNTYVCGGKKITISPIGNGNSPAKYFTVHHDEVLIVKDSN